MSQQEATVLKMRPHRRTHTRTDTILLTKELIATWKLPMFQRELRVNAKVRAVAEELRRDGGVIPGVITLGIVGRVTYIIDGQHRIHAFRISGLEEAYADVRIHEFETEAEAGAEYVRLNSRLVTLKPDDTLRGLEASLPCLLKIRQERPFVGYGGIRRSETSPIVSMSQLLRCWYGSQPETPKGHSSSAIDLAMQLTKDEASTIVDALGLLERAWGRRLEYGRLWNALNLSLCFWLYRRTVVTNYSPSTTRLTRDLFTKSMMALSANGDFLDWLVGRQLTDRDRSPAYARIKSIVTKRVTAETGKATKMPAPAWSKGHL